MGNNCCCESSDRKESMVMELRELYKEEARILEYNKQSRFDNKYPRGEERSV